MPDAYEEQALRLEGITDNAEVCAGRICTAADMAETELTNIEAKNQQSIGIVNAMEQRIDAVDDSSLIAEVSLQETSRIIPPNMLKYGGTFAIKTASTEDTSGSFTDESGILSSYNGSTFQFAGNFIHNNTNHGGASGELNTSMNALVNKLAAMGRGTLRYGVTFNEARINAGTGIISTRTIAGNTYYRMCGSSPKVIGRKFTIAYWLRVAGMPVAVDCAKIDGVWNNAAKINKTIVLNPGNYHIVSLSGADTGYDRYISMFGNNELVSGGDYSRAYISMPYLSTGHINLLPEDHLSPIPSTYITEEV